MASCSPACKRAADARALRLRGGKAVVEVYGHRKRRCARSRAADGLLQPGRSAASAGTHVKLRPARGEPCRRSASQPPLARLAAGRSLHYLTRLSCISFTSASFALVTAALRSPPWTSTTDLLGAVHPVPLLRQIARAGEGERRGSGRLASHGVRSSEWLQYCQDNAGEWRWRFRAANGEIIAVSSEGYSSKWACQRSIELVKQNAADASVEETQA